jgi:hypothetical protein
MPLLRYFGFGGSALVLLLFGLSWCFPQPVSEPIHSGIDRPVVRISSVEQLPERVVIDTRLPTIAPPSSALEFAERWPEAEIVETNPRPGPTISNAGDGVPKKPNAAKRETRKKAASYRATPLANNEPTPSRGIQAAAPVIRMSLLDILKERLGQNLFKLN